MKKSWMLFLVGALVTAGGLAMSARAQSNVVYAVEYNQSTNHFGTINLLNGTFTEISSFGSATINDIAYCPTNGVLYGISNSLALVTFNKTNGIVTKVANLSASSIESLAFRPSDGALFGATQSKLYTINPANGTATSVGNYGSPTNLGTTGQNIRFAQDGNLYVSNTRTNTDIYRINTTNGAATWMGEAVGYPDLMLQNASSNMYGVFINLGSASNATPELATFNLGSFVNGGTNANGSTHQITVTLVGAGTNFPANFNFSGNVPQTITNLTVPVSASGPSNQTAVVGGNVVFSTVASGTGPYNYAWLENGAVINGQTNSSLTLNNVTTNEATTYSVIVGGAMGTVTNSATLTVNVPVSVTGAPVNQTTVVGGNVTFSVTATGTGLSYQWLFNSSVIGTSSSLTLNNVTTSQAGIYTVIVNGAAGNPVTNSATLTVNVPVSVTAAPVNQTTVVGSNVTFSVTAAGTGLSYQWLFNSSVIGTSSSLTLNNVTTSQAGIYTVIVSGAAGNPVTNSATLTVNKAGATITLGSLSQTYDGTPKAATATTIPSGLAVSFTYNGLATVPTNAGSYTVIGTINDANYQGSATNTLVIAQASGSITLGSLSQSYSDTAKAATATTIPSGLAVSFTYNGLAMIPTNAGSYTVIATINDANYQGSATNALTINALPVTLTGSRSYDGTTTVAAEILTVANKVGSDNVTVAAGSGTLAGANVGSEAITSLGTLALGGTAAGNYTLAGASGSVTITVSAVALTVTNLVALNRVYDGTTNATLNATNAGLAGVLNGDSVTLVTSNGVAYFADKNVGTNKPVTVTGLGLGGWAAANYTLMDPTNLTANITAAGLSVSGVTAVGKVYDGTTNAQLDGLATLNGEVSGDDMNLVTGGESAAFAGPNVGTGLLVTVSGYALSGTDAGNYVLTQPTGLTANITPAGLTLTAVANSKTYDGTTNALAVPTVVGLQGTDTVTGLAESYATKNAGTGKTLSVSAYTVNDGNGGNNYTVSTVASTTGVINPAILTITAAANTKTYDGTTSASAIPITSGLQGFDSVSGLAETYDTKNAGMGKTLSVSAYVVNDGNSGNNYIVSTLASTAGVINPATLTITASANTKTYDGTTSASATPTTSSLQGSDSVSGLAETYDTKNVGSGKTLSVSVYTVNDGNSGGNYTVNTVASTAGVINPAILTVTANNKSKMYGQPNPPLTASYNGFVNGESTNVLTSPVILSTTATTASGAGQYPITASGATAADYTVNYVSGLLAVDPTPLLTAVDPNVNGNDQFIISWPTVTGRTYQLEYKDDLMAATWTPQGSSLLGNDAMAVVTNNISDSPHRFFRVEIQ